MMTGTTLMDSNERQALQRGPTENGYPEPQEAAQETTLVPMLIWGLVLIIIGMVFAVLVS